MDGILNINKPSGKTSFSIVSTVKHLSGERHAGHAGTLDPLASGVLPVCLGQATRVVEYLFDATKTYIAGIQLGIATDTDDAEGKIIRQCDPSGIKREDVANILAQFRGVIQQTPPMYSAVKHQGKPLYELARSGITVERKSRAAKILSIELTDWQPPVATIAVVCGKGTYIRTIAHDLGEMLGCGASLKSLIRTRVGPFDIQEALTLPQLEEAAHAGNLQQMLYPVDSVLLHYPALVVNTADAWALSHGVAMPLKYSEQTATPPASGERSRVYTEDGNFLGVVTFDSEKKEWQPEKMFTRTFTLQSPHPFPPYHSESSEESAPLPPS